MDVAKADLLGDVLSSSVVVATPKTSTRNQHQPELPGPRDLTRQRPRDGESSAPMSMLWQRGCGMGKRLGD